MTDLRPVLFVFGMLLWVLAAAMAVPAVAALSTGGPSWDVFAASAACTFFGGGLLLLTCRTDRRLALNLRQGFLLTTISWFGLSMFAALPFLLFGGSLSWADAVFEAVSGFTTTGSTVLSGLDTAPPGILLWRSILQWVGGIGVIGMAILLLPFLRVGGMQLFRMESSDRSDKVVSRPAELMVYIALVYLVISIACALAYWGAGMSGFDAICHAMTTVSTGGYSTHDASFGHFSSETRWIGVVFMCLGSLPFVAYIRSLRGRGIPLWRDSQVSAFVVFLACVCLSLAAWLTVVVDMPPLEALREATFNVVSIVTTTGYASQDYMAWGPFAIPLFFFLTVAGGCTGSTSGGIKILRFQILRIMIVNQLRQLATPHGVFIERYQGRELPADSVSSVLAFTFVFIMSIAVLALALAAYGLDYASAFSGAATALANVGPGVGPVIGPAGNFSTLPEGAKWLLSLGMLLGRLELFTVLVLFTPAFWRF